MRGPMPIVRSRRRARVSGGASGRGGSARIDAVRDDDDGARAVSRARRTTSARSPGRGTGVEVGVVRERGYRASASSSSRTASIPRASPSTRGAPIPGRVVYCGNDRHGPRHGDPDRGGAHARAGRTAATSSSSSATGPSGRARGARAKLGAAERDLRRRVPARGAPRAAGQRRGRGRDPTRPAAAGRRAVGPKVLEYMAAASGGRRRLRLDGRGHRAVGGGHRVPARAARRARRGDRAGHRRSRASAAMGLSGRRYVEANLTRRVAVDRLDGALRSLADHGSL